MNESKVFDNLSPTKEELRTLAYDTSYEYFEQDWDICAVNFDHRQLYIEFALDEQCPRKELFMHMLYVLAGSIVFDQISTPMSYDPEAKKVVYLDPVSPPGSALANHAVEKENALISDLSNFDAPWIKKLIESIQTLIATNGDSFNYDFWFHHN